MWCDGAWELAWSLWGVSGPSGLGAVAGRSALLIRHCLVSAAAVEHWLGFSSE